MDLESCLATAAAAEEEAQSEAMDGAEWWEEKDGRRAGGQVFNRRSGLILEG